ncbi:hypothetical protein CC79DRAFT_1075778 [Sarocladium strictum]
MRAFPRLYSRQAAAHRPNASGVERRTPTPSSTSCHRPPTNVHYPPSSGASGRHTYTPKATPSFALHRPSSRLHSAALPVTRFPAHPLNWRKPWSCRATKLPVPLESQFRVESSRRASIDCRVRVPLRRINISKTCETDSSSLTSSSSPLFLLLS